MLLTPPPVTNCHTFSEPLPLERDVLYGRPLRPSRRGSATQPPPLFCGGPPGADPGQLLFILYTTPLSHLIKSSSVDHHLYADDNQLFISFSQASFSTSIAHLLSVVNQISQWMSSNLLCLNPSKTEFIIIGLPALIKKIPDSSIRLSNNSFSTTFISDALSAILVLLLILISHSPTSPTPASCTYAISAASDPCLTLKLHPPLPPPSSTQN